MDLSSSYRQVWEPACIWILWKLIMWWENGNKLSMNAPLIPAACHFLLFSTTSRLHIMCASLPLALISTSSPYFHFLFFSPPLPCLPPHHNLTYPPHMLHFLHLFFFKCIYIFQNFPPLFLSFSFFFHTSPILWNEWVTRFQFSTPGPLAAGWHLSGRHTHTCWVCRQQLLILHSYYIWYHGEYQTHILYSRAHTYKHKEYS